jgi:hypothetical protein
MSISETGWQKTTPIQMEFIFAFSKKIQAGKP